MIVVSFERVMPKVLRATYRNEKCEVVEVREHGDCPESVWAYLEPVLDGEAEFEAEWKFDVGRARKPETIIRKILTASHQPTS